jgi:hypothetical protein
MFIILVGTDGFTLTPALADDSLNLLVGKSIIVRRGRGVYRFTDNLFCEWLKISDNDF